MSSSRAIVPFSSIWTSSLVILPGDAVGGFRTLELRARNGVRPDQPRVAIELRAGVREPRLGRAHLRFAPQPLLGPFARLQRPEDRTALVELALQ